MDGKIYDVAGNDILWTLNPLRGFLSSTKPCGCDAPNPSDYREGSIWQCACKKVWQTRLTSGTPNVWIRKRLGRITIMPRAKPTRWSRAVHIGTLGAGEEVRIPIDQFK